MRLPRDSAGGTRLRVPTAGEPPTALLHRGEQWVAKTGGMKAKLRACRWRFGSSPGDARLLSIRSGSLPACHLLPSHRQEAGGGWRVNTAPQASHPELFAPSIMPRALLSAGKSGQKVAGTTRPRPMALPRVWPWDKSAGNAVRTHHLKRKPEHRSTGGRGGKEAV